LLAAVIAGHCACVLSDTGAEANMLAEHFVRRHKLEHLLQPTKHQIRYGDGRLRPAAGVLVGRLALLTRSHPWCVDEMRFIVAPLQSGYDAILGQPFNRAHQPEVRWSEGTLALRHLRGRKGTVLCRTAPKSCSQQAPRAVDASASAVELRPGPSNVIGAALPGASDSSHRAERHASSAESAATPFAAVTAAVVSEPLHRALTAGSGVMLAARQAADADPAYRAQVQLELSMGRDPSDPFAVRDGLLYQGDCLLVPDDAQLRTALIAVCHDAATAAHQGEDHSLARLRKRCYWPHMDRDVAEYVATSSCPPPAAAAAAGCRKSVLGGQDSLRSGNLPPPASRRTDKLAARFGGSLPAAALESPSAYRLAVPLLQLPSTRIEATQSLRVLRRSARFAWRPDPRPRSPPEADSVSGQPAWEVKRLLGKRLLRGRVQYLVEWLGHPLESASWEPAGSLRCPHLLREFNELQDAAADARGDGDDAEPMEA